MHHVVLVLNLGKMGSLDPASVAVDSFGPVDVATGWFWAKPVSFSDDRWLACRLIKQRIDHLKVFKTVLVLVHLHLADLVHTHGLGHGEFVARAVFETTLAALNLVELLGWRIIKFLLILKIVLSMAVIIIKSLLLELRSASLVVSLVHLVHSVHWRSTEVVILLILLILLLLELIVLELLLRHLLGLDLASSLAKSLVIHRRHAILLAKLRICIWV